MKIVVLDGYTENPGDLSWDDLAALGALRVYERTQSAEIIPRIGDAEAVITNKTPLSAAVFDACPTIRYVGVLATGYNVVDVQAAKSRNILVSNIPTYGTQAVAQYVFALLLEVCHHVGAHSQSVYDGQWETCQDFCFWNYPLTELFGKTMGIVGYGRIGQSVAQLAMAFGMNVLVNDIRNPITVPTERLQFALLDELFAQSDIISLHCPLFESTKGMINKRNIAKMKNGIILINTSRGPLIVEDDLKDALNTGKVGYAAVDVVSTEPILGSNPLLQAKNCIITPHIAWAPKESRKRLMDIAVDNLKAFINGKAQNIVNL